MKNPVQKLTQTPPPGRPSWGGEGDLPLIYLGWGERDFAKSPLPVHSDQGSNYFILLRGKIEIVSNLKKQTMHGPAIFITDPACAFGITQPRSENVEILVWVWRGHSIQTELQAEPGGFLSLGLNPSSLRLLEKLHHDCRKEVELSDICAPTALTALRTLIEVEILRATMQTVITSDVRWKLAEIWMERNLSIHTPVPALCDYLSMSASTLRRLFLKKTGKSPGAFFRSLKIAEAHRLIHRENWQVKAVAYHLGYRHPNDLSRALTTQNLIPNDF